MGRLTRVTPAPGGRVSAAPSQRRLQGPGRGRGQAGVLFALSLPLCPCSRAGGAPRRPVLTQPKDGRQNRESAMGTSAA